jgi:DNA helicase-2/ATP-dependent DNA helicase PcrA
VDWTDEQRRILDHPLDAHAVVRAVPGAGKTTTLVGRVARLVEQGVAPERIRVVMFNKAVQTHFQERLTGLGVRRVSVQTFDALGYEVLRRANQRGIGRRYVFHEDHTRRWAREVWRAYQAQFDSPDDIENGVTFWKAHLIPVKRARFLTEPALVDAYRDWEALRTEGETLRIGYEDMVYTAVGLLGQHPGLLGPIDHFLIDEFQDVNPGRVELVRRLSHAGTTVTGVGDEDQAINEWCGAHPDYFHAFDATFPGLPTRSYTLSKSFRFGARLAEAAHRVIRNNTVRTPVQVVGGGQTEGLIQRIDDVAGAVGQLLEDGWRASDIAVLYRARAQGAAAIAALVAVKIPIQTEDAHLLRKGPGPELALAYLRHATSDAPVRFEEVWPVVQAPSRYIQKEAFQRQVAQLGGGGLKAVLRDTRLARSLGQNPGAIDAMEDLHRLLTRMGRAATAGAALTLLDDAADVDAQLRNRLRSEKDQELAVAAFYAVKALFDGLGVSPADAARAVEELDPGRGADERVLASTIHKVKGREWRCVVLPGLIEGACPAEQRGSVPGTDESPEGIAQTPWMEQERRVFYVGLTRAIDQLLLQVPPDAPSRFVAELEGPPPARATPARKPKDIVAAVTRRVPGGRAPAAERWAEGAQWTPSDDEALADAWDNGEALSALAARFGRSTSGIAARLVRIGAVADRAEARKRK